MSEPPHQATPPAPSGPGDSSPPDAPTDETAAPTSGASASGPRRGRGGWAGAAPVLWALAGVVVTLLIVVVVKVTDQADPGDGAPPARSSQPAVSAQAPRPLGSSRERFAELYLNYLLHSYYTESKGFCQPLLRKVCLALFHAELLAHADTCEALPNDAFILAIGRYQHRVGLPVDGKAGPETVRMMIGGDYSNRRGMTETFCEAAIPSDAGSPDADAGR